MGLPLKRGAFLVWNAIFFERINIHIIQLNKTIRLEPLQGDADRPTPEKGLPQRR